MKDFGGDDDAAADDDNDDDAGGDDGGMNQITMTTMLMRKLRDVPS